MFSNVRYLVRRRYAKTKVLFHIIIIKIKKIIVVVVVTVVSTH